MKHTKQLFMILLVAFLLVGLGTLAASEVTKNDTSVTKTTEVSKTNTVSKDTATANKVQATQKSNDNTNIVDTINENIKNKPIKKSNTANKVKTASINVDVNDFNSLKGNLTSAAYDTVTININKNITLDGNTALNNKITSLTINGNGNTIDGQNKYQFLRINHNTTTTTLNNIKIENCNTTHGGAIYIYGSNNTLNINNAQFTNNNAIKTGGAIRLGINNTLNIKNSQFTNNGATEHTSGNISGGAIYASTNNTITIDNTQFTNNTATVAGGAIRVHINNTLDIKNSQFTNNGATESPDRDSTGGAIYASSNNTLTIDNTQFTNNTATQTGGAIRLYQNNTLDIKNSQFTNNVVTERLTSELASGGGAIHASSNNTITIDNTQFTNNTAQHGGAVYVLNDSIININNTHFINNTARTGGAGAVRLYGKNATIMNSVFTDNFSDKQGGAIYKQNGALTLINTNFTNNSAPFRGGAIFTTGEFGTYVYNCTFTNHTSSRGGAIRSKIDDNLVIMNSKFINNSATEFDGGAVSRDGNATLVNVTFIDNTAPVGGAFSSDYEPEYNASEEYAVTMADCTFINNTAETGGAISNRLNLTITNSTFNDNNADYGGAINSRGNLDIDNSTFENNSVKSENSYVVDFPTANNVKITDSYFRNNTDDKRDMLFSDAKSDANVDIHDNTYIDNFLEDTITTPNNPIITDNKDTTHNYDIELDLRDIYNDTVRNGTLTVYVNGEPKGTATVKDGKATISLNNADLTKRENNITLEYTVPGKHYQTNSAEFSVLKEVNTLLSIEAPASMISGDTAEINFTLTDGDKKPLNGENIHVFVDDVNVANLTTNADGVAVYVFTPQTDGLVTIGGTHHTDDDSIYIGAKDVKAEIDVSKIQPEIRIRNTTELLAHHEVELEFNLTDHEGQAISNKLLNIKISEEGKQDIIGTATTNNNGIATFKFTPDDDGTFWVNATFAGDIRYHHATEAVELSKDNVMTNLEISATDTKINKTNLITIKVIPVNKALIDGSVTLNISGEIHTVNIREGSGIYNYYKSPTAGDKNITGYFTSSTQGYGHSFAEEEFTVEKLPTQATITVLTNKAGNVTLKATIKPEDNIQSIVNGGIIEIKSTTAGNEKIIYSGRLTNGEVTIKTDIQETGWYDFEVIYHGNEYFTPTGNNTGTVQVLPVNTKTTAYDKTANIGSKIILNATLKDEKGANINGQEVTFYINKRQVGQTTTNGNGVATIEYTLPTSMTAGKYPITAQYNGNKKYNASSGDATLTVNPLPTEIKTEIRDNTLDNTTIKVTLTSPTENNKPVPNAPIVITDKKGNIIGEKTTDRNGEATIKLDIPVGSNPIKITYPGNHTYLTSKDDETINVAKIPTTTTITVQNNTAGNVMVTGTVKDKYGRNVPEGTVNIKQGNTIVGTATINKGAYTIKTSIGSKGPVTLVAEYTGTNTYLPSSSQTSTNIIAQTPTITAKGIGNKVGNTSINTTLKDPAGKPIPNAPIRVTLPNGTQIPGTTNKDGIANIPLDLREGTHILTITYPGNGTYDPVTTKETMVVTKNTPTIKLNPVRGIIGEDITLTAYLTGVNGEKITGGNLVFKLNGKSLRTDGRFDSNAPAMKLPVKDGKVTITLKADLYLRNTKNLTASYSGNYKYEEIGSPTVEAQIQKRYANVTLTVSPTWNKQYDTIKFTATVRDTTKNGKNTTLINQNTSVMFKVNGNTLKDKNGKIIYVPVDANKQATYYYTIPAGTGGITASKQVRDYKVEAVFVGINYYPGFRNSSKFNVERSPITININEAKVNTKNVLSVKATIKDYKGNNVVGTNKYTIKVNGKSYTDKNGKPVYWSAKNGVINLSGIQIDPKTTIKRVMVVTGERQAYHEGRNETTNIIKA